MTLSDHSLRQIDEEYIRSLPADAVLTLAIKLLNDLKESREQLNRNSQNSSVPPGSEAPWDKGSKYCDEDQDDDDALLDEEEMLWQRKMKIGSIYIDLCRTVERGGKNKVWLRALIGN